MKRLNVWRTIFLLSVMFSLAGSDLYAQNRRGQGNGMPRYDKSKEMTLKAGVERVESLKGRMGWKGTHLTIRFEGESLSVHVGPSDYLIQQGFVFAEGDEIEVTGSKIKFKDKDILLAREIKIGNKLLTLRNEQGIPEWSRNKWRY